MHNLPAVSEVYIYVVSSKSHDAADDQEPDHELDGFHHLLYVLGVFAVDFNLAQILETDRQIKDRAHSDWAEETDKCGLGN